MSDDHGERIARLEEAHKGLVGDVARVERRIVDIATVVQGRAGDNGLKSYISTEVRDRAESDKWIIRNLRLIWLVVLLALAEEKGMVQAAIRLLTP